MNENIQVLSFNKANIPTPYEQVSPNADDNRFIHWGVDNLYPNFLLKLYSESPMHQAIVNSKVTYVLGDGLKYKGAESLVVNVNANDTFEQFINKIIKDYLIFNYFAVEVCYNVLNQPTEFHYIPSHKIRFNKSKTKFWFCEDWLNNRPKIMYDRWQLNTTDSTSKIFLFEGYSPSINNVYPSPEYHGSIKSISTDIAIIDFNLNNIKNNFSVNTMITYFKGANIPEEVRQILLNGIKSAYAGENGNKILVDFADENGKAADVQQLSDNSWADAYVQLQSSVEASILKGHSVTSPMLMGIKTEGQLGGSTELETAYQIFKNTYIRTKRAELLSGINLLFSNSTIITQALEFTDKPLFETKLSDALVEKVYTINELRQQVGLPALPNGDRLISEVAPATQTPDTGSTFNDVKKKSNLKQLSEDDFEKIKHLGTLIDEFHSVEDYTEDSYNKAVLKFGKTDDIAKWVIVNDIKGLSIAEIRNELRKDTGIDVSVSELDSTLKDLDTSGVIKVTSTDGKIDIMPSTKADVPDTRKIETMYQYEVRPGLGNPIIANTRSFCRKLIENNRLYTREEVQQMSSIFGYDIFQYCGGFYYNPETEETTPYCRHNFKQKIVTRKAKG